MTPSQDTPRPRTTLVKRALLPAISLALLGITGCGDAPRETGPGDSGDPATGKPTVLTTFYPTQYFTERIASDLVDVACPVPGGEDPIFWMPDDAAIARYQSADLIVVNGAGFEKWLGKVSLPESNIVDTAKPLADSFIRYENAVAHSHGKGGEHSHEGLDGHTWLDPQNAKVQAREILAALTRKFPQHEQAFTVGFKGLADDLDALDAEFRSLVASGSTPPPLLASHPAYNYLAARYAWDIENLDLDPGSAPNEAQLAEIDEILLSHPAKTLIWESPPLEEIAETLQRRSGIRSIVISPSELHTPGDPDFLEAMRQNVELLRPAFDTPGGHTAP